MDKFNNMRVFCRIVELGTFSSVAKEFKCSPMMISKYMAQLESALGVMLLQRTTRSLSLTSAGEVFYNRCLQLLDDLNDLEMLTSQMGDSVKGSLKVCVPIDFGGLYMVSMVDKFMREYPDVKIQMSLDNKPPNLRTGYFDISIVVSDKLDPGVVAKKITETELCMFASPSYIEKHGMPESIEDLITHKCLHYLDTPHGDDWIFLENGGTKKIPIEWQLASNNGRALCEAASLGMGIVRAPRLSVNRYLEQGILIEILPDQVKPVIPVFATYLQRRFYPAKLTVFIQCLMDFFNQAAPQISAETKF